MSKKRISIISLILVLVAILSIALVGCSKEEAKEEVDKIEDKAEETKDEAEDKLDDLKEELTEKEEAVLEKSYEELTEAEIKIYEELEKGENLSDSLQKKIADNIDRLRKEKEELNK